jgi:hypothetical protein
MVTREHRQPVRSSVRRLLGRKVSIEAMIEFGLWMSIPNILIGVLWSFMNYETVTAIENQLAPLLPAGADLIAFGLTTGLWPLFLLTSGLCTV